MPCARTRLNFNLKNSSEPSRSWIFFICNPLAQQIAIDAYKRKHLAHTDETLVSKHYLRREKVPGQSSNYGGRRKRAAIEALRLISAACSLSDRFLPRLIDKSAALVCRPNC